MIPQTEYQQRRQHLMQQLPENSIAIICTRPEYPRTQDCNYRFRPASNFYYLTGFTEPDAIIVLIPGRAEGEYIFFNRVNDPEQEMWHGHRAGQAGAIKHFLADQAFPIEEFDEIVPELIKNKSVLAYQFGFENDIDHEIASWRDAIRTQIRQGANFPATIINISEMLNEMRVIKSPVEIAVLKKGGAINTLAHKRAMQMCAPGMTELQLFSELNYVYGQHNCLDLAYDPIVAGGKNACVLHYRAGPEVLKDGELVLIDMGQEFECYGSDVTRTFPVNGKFSPEQKIIYQLVLDIQLALIDFIKPGLLYNEIQKKAVRLMTEGLVNIGLLAGKIDELIDSKAYFDFYPHGAGHWLGLDIHDVSNYKIGHEWRPLEVGMVFTIEPGIYVQLDNTKVDKKWHGIGVRIEDNIVVTQTGCEILNANLPKTIAEIEALMAT